MKLRALFVLPAIGVISMMSMASAAGLNIDNTPTAQVGSDLDLTCDSAVQVYINNNWDTNDNRFEVASVTVAGISSSCVGVGKTVKVQLTNAGNEIGPTLGLPHTLDQNEVFDFTGANVPTLDATDVHVVIQG